MRLGVVMDDIHDIHIQKDSTFAILLAAFARGYELYYMQQHDLMLRDTEVMAHVSRLTVRDDETSWFEIQTTEVLPLKSLDAILMRKDPPFDMEYIYTTYLLELAMAAGVVVVNHPQSLRDYNEKMSTAWFPTCCPATVVSRNKSVIRAFYEEQQEIVIKPLEGMGGRSVFHLRQGDPNVNVVIDTLTHNGQHSVMAQRYIPEIISAGDKRILLIDGKPIPFGLARIPAGIDGRGNLAQGAQGVVFKLTPRDFWIAEQIGPTLAAKGLWFVGIDVIGDYLTEINITSPTCIREIERESSFDITGALLDALQKKLK